VTANVDFVIRFQSTFAASLFLRTS